MLLALGFLATAAQAHTDPATYAVLADPDRSLTIADMEKAQFTPVSSTFGGGLSDMSYWLRIRFSQADPPPSQVRLRPSMTDRIEFYTPLPDGAWHLSQGGEITAPTGAAQTGFGWYGFTVDPSPANRVFYLRVTPASAAAITVSTVTLGLDLREDLHTALWHVAILALQFLAMALVLLRLDPLQSAASFFFLAMVTCLAGYFYWVNGYGALALGLGAQPLNETVQEGLASLNVAVLAAFHHFHLRDYRPPPWARRISAGFVGFAVLGLGAAMAGVQSIAGPVVLVATILIVPVLILLLCTIRHDAPIRRLPLRLVYDGYLLVLATNIGARFGLFDLGFLFSHGLDVMAVLASTFILALLWVQNSAARTIILQNEVAAAQISADLAVAETYHTTQLRLLRGIDRLVQDLNDQTRRVIDKGGFADVTDRVLRVTGTLKSVTERYLFVFEAEDTRWTVTPARFDLSKAVRDLTAALAPDGAWRLDLQPVFLTSDPVLLDLCTRNVLVNALNYGLPEDAVSVNVAAQLREGRMGALITVTNRVATRTPFDPGRVFGKFYRGPAAQAKSGTGLGLFIAREVLGLLGGTITLTGPQPGAAEPAVTAHIWIPDL